MTSTLKAIAAPHRCSYLPGRQAVSLFLDPGVPKDMVLYSRLARQGFRRSGEEVYRPQCPRCQACVPVRIPVHEFAANRRQRRTYRANRDLEIRWRRPAFSEEYFRLYRAYLQARHPDAGMDDPDPEHFLRFLTAGWCDTYFLELRLGAALLAVAVVDRLEDGLSAVYSFFDPTHSRRSLGGHAVLLQIEEARCLGLDWLYLGYWISACKKMSYKGDFRPLECYREGQWARIS
ncbi:MAG: arginyltransferase [Gammaproteobacteria bacterium]